MEVDIACVGFGPAMGGFLTTLTRGVEASIRTIRRLPAGLTPGMPLQVLCYERADDLAAGVSGVVTRAQGIRASFPELDPAEIPMAAAVTEERVLYLLDPIGASRRSCAAALGGFSAACAGPLAAAREGRCVRAAVDAGVSCTSMAGWCCRSGSSTSGWARS